MPIDHLDYDGTFNYKIMEKSFMFLLLEINGWILDMVENFFFLSFYISK